MFMVCLNHIPRISIDLIKENDFTLKKTSSRWYSTETMTDTDYADDLVLLANTPDQAKSTLHSLKQVAGDIGLYMNINKTEFMYFKQERTISTLSDSLKLIVQFTYIGSNILSTESNINICLAKAWTDIDMAVWSLWQNKTGFLPSYVCQYHCMDGLSGLKGNPWRKI